MLAAMAAMRRLRVCGQRASPSHALPHRSGPSARRSGAGFELVRPRSGASHRGERVSPQSILGRTALTLHEDYLNGRWAEGCRNAALLWRELVARGFSGRPGVVRRWAEARPRKEPRDSAKSVDVARQSGCQLARLLMTDPAMLPKAERSLVPHLLDQVPSMADAITVAKRLNALLRRKTSDGLSQILDAAAETPLKSFAESLRRDINAIQASLDPHESPHFSEAV